MGNEGGFFVSPSVNGLKISHHENLISDDDSKASSSATSNLSSLYNKTSDVWGPFSLQGDEDEDSIIQISGKSVLLLNSSVLSLYAAAASDSCALNGQGRFIRTITSHTNHQEKNDDDDDDGDNDNIYTVSGCDVLQGHFVLMYFPAKNKIMLYAQTFGPMSYTAALLVSWFFLSPYFFFFLFLHF